MFLYIGVHCILYLLDGCDHGIPEVWSLSTGIEGEEGEEEGEGGGGGRLSRTVTLT